MKMRSQWRTVVSRWAISTMVLAWPRFLTASITARSVMLSSALVASSRISTSGIVVERPGDADPLALAAAEPHPALAHVGGVALGQLAGHEVVQLGDARRALHRRLVDPLRGLAEGDVGADRVVDQEDLLRHVADVVLPGAAVRRGDRRAVDPDLARLRLEQPEHEVDRGGLAGAGAADEADGGVGRDGQAEPAQRRPLGVGIGVVDVGQFEPLAQPQRRDARGGRGQPEIRRRRPAAARMSLCSRSSTGWEKRTAVMPL